MRNRLTPALGAVALTAMSGSASAQYQTGGGQPPQYVLGASVLPTARSIPMTPGASVSFSAAVSNPAASGNTAINCTAELPGLGGSFDFQPTDADGNPAGPVNAVFSIPAGGTQHLELTYYPVSASHSGEVLAFVFDCGNRQPALASHGLNISYLTTSPATAPAPDILATLYPAQPSASGGMQLEAATGQGYVSAAATNMGASGLVRVEAMSPEAFLQYTTAPQSEIDMASDLNGASFTLCRMFYGSCVHAPSMVVDTSTFVSGWAIFDVRASGAAAPITHTPAYNRVFLVFTEQGSGRLVGASSIAICTEGMPGC